MQSIISKSNLEKWSDYLLNYSLGGVKKDDIIMIKGEHITWPLISVLQDKIFKAGGIVDINIVAPDNNRGQVWGASIAKNGSIDQINKVPEWQKTRYEQMTKYIEILGAEDPASFANLPEKLNSAITKVDMPYKQLRLAKPWVLTLFPTQAFAQLEDMTLAEYTNVIINTSLTDPKLLDSVEDPIANLMNKSKTIKIQTEHPTSNELLTLNMDVEQQSAVKCTGHHNFPDGEVFTSPDANSVDGEIFVDLPVFFNGVTIEGIYLKIKNGIIIEYIAQRENDTLKMIIETDEGSHRIGEIALGMNKGLTKALKHPLFVEKVGGTVHIAIGESYPECYVENPNSDQSKIEIDDLKHKGIVNASAQHVDIVIDFREGGVGRKLFFDNQELISEDNIWKIK